MAFAKVFAEAGLVGWEGESDGMVDREVKSGSMISFSVARWIGLRCVKKFGMEGHVRKSFFRGGFWSFGWMSS